MQQEEAESPPCLTLTEQGAPPADLVNPRAGPRAAAGQPAQLLADGDRGLSAETWGREGITEPCGAFARPCFFPLSIQH